MCICYECGQDWKLNAPSHGHEPWCGQGHDEGRWLNRGLSQYERDQGYVLIINEGNQPELIHKDELAERLEELHSDS